MFENEGGNFILAQQIPGTCPHGFTPGTYGVGKCYRLYRQAVQMAIAVLACRDTHSQLTTIDSAAEELFLKIFITGSQPGKNTIFASFFPFLSF